MRKLLIMATALLVASYVWGNGKDEVPPPMMEAAMDTQMEAGAPVPPPAAMGGEFMKPSDKDLQKMLSPLQYQVTQHEGTEAPWNNTYWDLKEKGIYVDVVSGEPLFSSTHKYDSRTGWPSFTQPLEAGNIVEIKDAAYGMVRVEIRSFYGDSHLGHVFDDGPAPTGLRYCMNSASLRFIPVEEMEKEGYGTYLSLFENK